MSYYEERLQQLGITDDINVIKLLKSNPDGPGNILKPEPVFRRHDKGIEIIVYTLDRCQPTYSTETSRYKKNWSIVRYEHPIVKPNGDEIKYLMPKGQGSYPFFPPSLVDKFDRRDKIKTLYLIEGYFKAFKGSMHGVDIVGVASITHLKNKETGGLHSDIIRLIKLCSVERVVWLTDGDCLDISTKALVPGPEASDVDLYTRPNQFYASISTFKQLLDDYEVDKYFLHVDTDAIWEQYKSGGQLTRDKIKGLDDILITFPNQAEDIIADLQSVSKNGFWFQRFNITVVMSKVREYFRLQNVNTFILFHQDRRPELKGKTFTFHGTQYNYDAEKGECAIVTPGDAKLYFRVGDDYYKWVEVPNQYNQKEKQYHGRSKTTITDDHGKAFPKHVPKYEAFCNHPDHVNYQPVINNCFNVYCQLEHQPEDQPCTEEDFPCINAYMRHLFGENEATFIDPVTKERKKYKTVDMGYDYLQLLYQKPQQKLPILCLVSRENNTGKSTFAFFLRIMLGANVAIVGNADLSNDFNAHWATKSVVICDETKIDKVHVIEKVKSYSTARKIWVNAKGKGQVELDCFLKFILITNNEDNFIYVGDEDIRYWVIKVPQITAENPTIVDQFVEEMPAFLSYLGKRKMHTELRNRMWFHPDLLKTEALKKVIQHSQPTIQKELLHNIKEKFRDFGSEQVLMSLTDIRKDFFNNRYEANYLMDILKNKLKIEIWHTLDPEKKDLFGQPARISKTRRYSYPRWETVAKEIGKTGELIRVDIQATGRPYVFHRDQFLTPDEIAQIHISEEYKQLNDETPPPGLDFSKKLEEPKPDHLPF